MRIRDAHLWDALELAGTMRDEDRGEVRAASDRDPFVVLLEGLSISAEASVATIDGQVVCMWGVVPVNTGLLGPRVGWAWLLGSDLVDRHPKTFWRACKLELAKLLNRWDRLENAIWIGHAKALRWADRLGFQLQPPVRGFQCFTVTKEDLNV